MTISEDTEIHIARRDLLTLAGAAAAGGLAATSTALAQSQTPTGGPPPGQPQPNSTVVLDRLPMGVLLIGINRPEAQNRIDIPTFNASGQAYYEFEHDDGLRVAVLYGKGPDFSQGLDLQSWGAGLRAGPFRSHRDGGGDDLPPCRRGSARLCTVGGIRPLARFR